MTGEIKLFVINPLEQWETCGAAGIFARNQTEAESIYKDRYYESIGDDFAVEQVEIVPGLILEANGFDYAKMTVVR